MSSLNAPDLMCAVATLLVTLPNHGVTIVRDMPSQLGWIIDRDTIYLSTRYPPTTLPQTVDDITRAVHGPPLRAVPDFDDMDNASSGGGSLQVSAR